MLYGMSLEEFWRSNPRIVGIYAKAYNMKMKSFDEQMWAMGQYAYLATYAAVGKFFGDNSKFNFNYPDRPLTWPSKTQEEIDAEEADRELKKMLAVEEAWIREAKRMGLPDSL